jgi:hypothetical protein
MWPPDVAAPAMVAIVDELEGLQLRDETRASADESLLS